MCPFTRPSPRYSLGRYLKVQQPCEQGLASVGDIAQQILPLDDVDDLGQQQVLARVPQPGVEDPVGLQADTGCWKGSPTTPGLRTCLAWGGEKPG